MANSKSLQNQEIALLKKIEDYILGRLFQEEIDDLWIRFLLNPLLFEYLEIEINLRYHAKKLIKH